MANDTRLSSENLIHKPLTINNFLQINRLDIKKSYNRIITTAERLQMDPVTITAALSVAKSAFTAIKNGFAVGRDIESMGQDLGRWMGAVSDIKKAEEYSKKHPLFKKIFNAGSVEEEALNTLMAKKKAEDMREQLKSIIMFTRGHGAWEELLRTEAQIRKRRQQAIYDQAERRRKFIEISAVIFLAMVTAGFIIWVVWMFMKTRGMI